MFKIIKFNLSIIWLLIVLLCVLNVGYHMYITMLTVFAPHPEYPQRMAFVGYFMWWCMCVVYPIFEVLIAWFWGYGTLKNIPKYPKWWRQSSVKSC